MSEKHTPWKVDKQSWDGTEYWTVVDTNGDAVCQEPVEFTAYPECAFITPEGEPHHAALFAASPDLLAACKLALDLCYGKATHLTADRVNKQIEAAIAKAEGT